MGGRCAEKSRGKCAAALLFVVCLLGSIALLTMGILARPSGLLGRLQVKYAIIDLPSGKYRVSPAVASGPEHAEYFTSMIGRLKPHAAICGTYYDPDCKPIGDIVIDGKVVCRGGQRQGIGFTRDGKVKFFERIGRSRISWSGCTSGIACGPRLLRNGKIDINVQRDGFSAAAATNKARRCAVGVTRSGKLILCAVTEPVTLNTLAQLLLEMGAKSAINLDGGSMCALYENGKVHVQPVKPMSNILVVYKKK